ncbi:MAG: GNAT family N-acetyltransferase [Bacteroidota bacterium]
MRKSIFKANHDDYPDLIELWEASVTATHHFLDGTDIAHYKALIVNYYFDNLNLYFVRDEQGMLGFIGIADGNIQMLFLSPAFIGQGLGKHLVDFAVLMHNVTTVDVNEQNIAAKGFYENLGFEVIGRSEIDAAGKPFPVLSMTL